MKRRWQIALPLAGLLLFGAVTALSVQRNRDYYKSSRYFWWSALRLDRHSSETVPPPKCAPAAEDCVEWDPVYVHVDPGWLFYLFFFGALPAFVLGGLVVSGLGRLGVNEVWSFMTVMPIFIGSWFHFIGWLFDRWRLRRLSHAAHAHPLQ